MTTTRKSLLLSAGIAMVFVGAATASERSRGASDTVRAEDAVAAPATLSAAHMVSKGVGTANVNGQDVTMRVDGAVSYDDVVRNYGSVERMKFEASVSNTPSTLDSNGNLLFANGATGYFADLLGSNMPKPPARTAVERKKISPWIEKTVDGVTVLAFADGSVITDPTINQTEPPWVVHRDQVPNKLDMDGLRAYADNSVFLEPAAQHKDGQ